jgi:hypothetical protein
MNRKHLLATLLVLALLLLAGAWVLLRPEGDSLFPIIGADQPVSPGKTEESPLSSLPPQLDDSGKPVTDKPKANTEEDEGLLLGIDEADRARIKAAREEARIKAEAEAIEAAKNPPPDPKAPVAVGAPDNRTPEEKALDAERERRIAALKAIKHPPNQSLGNVRPGSRRLEKETGKKEFSEVSAKLLQDRRGLYAKYYAFQESPVAEYFDPSKPLIDQRTPDLTRIDPRVYFESKDDWADLPFDKTNFVATWEGFLVIKETGDFWLYIGADWLANVYLDGELVLLNNIRDYTEVSTVLTLTAGLHPIRIDYIEGVNGSVIDPMGSCNFMYVPQGQAKPIPVPPEMLMLPEALWSDAAPIITSLSRYEGEIGDEITIKGQNLLGSPNDPEAGTQLSDLIEQTQIEFSGQRAEILGGNSLSIRVRVPVGAVTGKLVVRKDEVPSNSVDFTVTTQFGLFASWHNLAGWSNYDFVDETLHKPDVVRLEKDFMFDTRADLDLSFRNNPLACHWEGKLGIPAGFVKDGEMALVRFQTYGRLRVKLGETLKETAAQTGGTFNLTTLDFEVTDPSEQFVPLSIDWTSETGPAGLKIVKLIPEVVTYSEETGNEEPVVWKEIETLQYQLFFPPVVPPKPPKILAAKPLYAESEQPPVLPFDVTTTRPSIREGQQFEFYMEVFGNAEVLAASVNITVDGVPLTYEVIATEVREGGVMRTCAAILPSGLGEGAIIARLTIVTSDPYYIDVQNKGLVAYYYDLPNPGGYAVMPDPEPLTCFQVRKDANVNFENANDFKLPFPAETFAVEWFGAIIIEREGDYRFTCRSDDGILVWVNDALVLVDNDLHYQREKTGDWVHLVPGTYNFRMQFFENNVHEVCVLQWDARDDKEKPETEFVQRGIIPKRNFTLDQHPALPQKTSTFKRADGSDPQ